MLRNLKWRFRVLYSRSFATTRRGGEKRAQSQLPQSNLAGASSIRVLPSLIAGTGEDIVKAPVLGIGEQRAPISSSHLAELGLQLSESRIERRTKRSDSAAITITPRLG